MIFQSAIWSERAIDQQVINKKSKEWHKDQLITKLLLDRGLESESEVEMFLNPKIEDLRDPLLLLDMDKAVERVKTAITNRENIWLYGDYDVDGITSISILMKYFKAIGIVSNYYIPDRIDEGYGISNQGLETIVEKGGNLVITVDCGITAIEQAKYAKSIGLDLIITDHHEFQGDLPDALAVINPKRGDYPFKSLAGCGVALKLVQALTGDEFGNFYDQVIDIAALGTVADIVPLVDENRVITSIGLAKMPNTNNPGIQALIAEAGLVGKEINSGHIGFVIAPRINASGRIGNPSIAVDMLLEDDYFTALEIAKALSQLNSERQSQEREILESAEAYIQRHINLDLERILLIVGEDWHTGIIGIVASKLSDKYSRPTIILNSDGENAKGSARSIEGISIYDVLSNFSHLFEKFGGHEQAAGLSLKAANIPLLKEGLIRYAIAHIQEYMLVSQERVDGVLEPKMVTHDLVETIEHLKPFGMGNPKPQFVFNHLIIEDYKTIGKLQNHLKMVVNDGNRVYDALAFNRSEFMKHLRKNEEIHLLMTLEKNNFMGVETIQFLIKDMIKERMPVGEQLKRRLEASQYRYILESNNNPDTQHFTSIDSFDIIFSVPSKLPVLIYSEEGINKFKEAVLSRNFVDYTLHFNELNESESREGFWDIVIFPVKVDHAAAYIYFADAYHLDVLSHIPTREDLAIFYKLASQKRDAKLQQLNHRGTFSLVKCRLCLELLSQMQLLNYQLNGDLVTLEWLPRPEHKIDMEQLPWYRQIQERWRK
ncbi:MAG: single-stranded-DNA-specific exonuclease RecJ [Clostridiales bacterium 38-18]|nr:MAG: single-stranded-DNA-specific exonuclease RecJ [Clostridiales bacterium 38-18]